MIHPPRGTCRRVARSILGARWPTMLVCPKNRSCGRLATEGRRHACWCDPAGRGRGPPCRFRQCPRRGRGLTPRRPWGGPRPGRRVRVGEDHPDPGDPGTAKGRPRERSALEGGPVDETREEGDPDRLQPDRADGVPGPDRCAQPQADHLRSGGGRVANPRAPRRREGTGCLRLCPGPGSARRSGSFRCIPTRCPAVSVRGW